MSSVLLWVFLGSLLALFEEVRAGEYCVTDTVVYCAWGCCGHYPNTHCCTIGTQAIVGLVSGCVILLAALVSSIVFCVCLYKQKKAKRARVLQGPTGWNSSPSLFPGPSHCAAGSYPGSLWYGPDGLPIQPPAYQATDVSLSASPSPPLFTPPLSPPPAYSVMSLPPFPSTANSDSVVQDAEQ